MPLFSKIIVKENMYSLSLRLGVEEFLRVLNGGTWFFNGQIFILKDGIVVLPLIG